MKDLNLLEYTGQHNDMLVKFYSNNEKVGGLPNLIQRIIKRIFTVQGSNAYRPSEGSQFDALFRAITVEEANDFKETFGILLSSVADQLKNEQVDFRDMLKDTEMLTDLTVDNMVYDPVFGGFLITIKVSTLANTNYTITI